MGPPPDAAPRTRPRRHRTVAGLLGALLLGVAAGPAAAATEARQGPIEGTPPVPDAVAGWAATYGDPAYWTTYARDALEQGHVNVPVPLDVVKPEAYLPNVVVPAGDRPSALPVAPRDLDEVTYTWQGRTKTLDEFVTTTRTDAVVFVHDGVVVGEWYANGYAPDVRHQPWSVTKTVVAATVGIAHDAGLIGSLDDPIEGYLPDLVGSAYEGVTIEQLLQMESGVHWDEDTPVLAVNTQVEQWVDLALDLFTEGAVGATRDEFLAALPAAYEPGSEWRYNSGNTQVLAWLTEALYDTTYDRVLADLLWGPMGAEGDAVVTADRLGGVIASHGLFALPHDLARFGELLRNGGVTPEGRRVVSTSWIDAMTTMTSTSEGRYGYQTWAHETAGPGAYSASGFQGQKVTVSPDDCLTGVRLSHAIGADVRDGDDPFDPASYGFALEFFSQEWQTAMRAVGDHLGGCGTTTALATGDDGDAAAGPGGASDGVTSEGDDTASEGDDTAADGAVGGAPATDDPAARVEPTSQPLPVTGASPAAAGLAMLALAGWLSRRARLA